LRQSSCPIVIRARPGGISAGHRLSGRTLVFVIDLLDVK
jgi:hypothetical protein